MGLPAERNWYWENDIQMLDRLIEEEVRMICPEKKPFRKPSFEVNQTWTEKVGGMDLIRKILDIDYHSRNHDENDPLAEK